MSWFTPVDAADAGRRARRSPPVAWSLGGDGLDARDPTDLPLACPRARRSWPSGPWPPDRSSAPTLPALSPSPCVGRTQNGGDPGRLPAEAGRRRRGHQSAEHPPSDRCPALAWRRSPTSPVGAEALAGDGRFRDRCAEALRSRIPLACGVPPTTWRAARPVRLRSPCRADGGFARPPTAVVSVRPPRFLRRPKPLVASRSRPAPFRCGEGDCWTSAEAPSIGIREIPRLIHQPFWLSPERRGCPPVGHRSMHRPARWWRLSAMTDLRPPPRRARRRSSTACSRSRSTAPRS